MESPPEPPTSSAASDGVAVDVLVALIEDRETDGLAPLAEYLRRFPGHEETVARCYLDVRRGSGGAAGSPGEGGADGTAAGPGAAAGADGQRVGDVAGDGAGVASGDGAHGAEDPAAGGDARDRAAEGDAGVRGSGDASPEQRIGDYRLLRELGRGGQGVVYLARDESLRRDVALKVLHPGFAGGPEAALRLQREAELTGKLDHSGVCPVYATGRHEGRSYLAMRYVAGRSLAERVVASREASNGVGVVQLPGGDAAAAAASDRAAVDAVLALVERAARALHAAHEAGIVHRDVKARNLMVTESGEPVVLDFGLARDGTEDGVTLTMSGDRLGTPASMSPEQLDGASRTLDRRTDVWSLGVVLFEALTLERPFTGATDAAVVAAIRTGLVPAVRSRNRRLPPDVNVVVATALERDLHRRYQTALDLAEDLRRVRTREPIRARPAGPWLRLRRWAQRRPALAASVSVLGLALVALAALGWHFQTTSAELTQERDDAIGHLTRLSDAELAEDLLAEEREELWPIGPEIVSPCERWEADVTAVLARRDDHAALLEHLRLRRDADGAYADASLRILDERLASLLALLDRLETRRPLVASRRERGTTLRARSLDDEAAAWEECRAAVADSFRYGGVALAPQLGLAPLGENAQDLWEFWVVESGARPRWDEARGGAVVDGDSGVVLVLIPGGTSTMGSHPVQGDNRDPMAQQNEAPPHRVTLDPFFLSKYELTQAQWAAADEGRNPSTWADGYVFDGAVVVDARNPVETVDWPAAQRIVRRLGLDLPTEAQWEYACRAGGTTVWSWGNVHEDAAVHGNFHGRESNPYLGSTPVHAYEDRHVRHAPVGSYAPNGFGLHDMHGNAFEWCRDVYLSYSTAVREGDGLRVGEEPPPADHRRLVRGGSFLQPAIYARAAMRIPLSPDGANADCGLRPSREVTP